MGWFENQIEERREADQLLLEDSFLKAAGVVLGSRGAERISDERIVTKNAIDEILKYYHFKFLSKNDFRISDICLHSNAV